MADMTIGEKIRYFREQFGITQKQLADATGIHPVSIRKYETNKMQPQISQIERIADVLCVSPNVLSGSDNNELRLQTVGDLMNLIISLFNAHVISINGERGDQKLLKPETVSISINPVLSNFLKVNIGNNQESHDISDLNILVSNKYSLLDAIIKWERMNYTYTTSCEAAGDSPNEATKAALARLKELKRSTEWELQRDLRCLDTSHGISVKICDIPEKRID